jgi:hypothetical protein
MRASNNDSVRRVVLPNASLVVFEDHLKEHQSEADLDQIRAQLSPITLTALFRNIYDNEMTIKRGFDWFARYTPMNDNLSTKRINL